MSRTKIQDCTHCGLPLGGSYMRVNGGQEAPSGDFHLRADENTRGCFEKACEEFDKRKNLDLETDGASDATVRPSADVEIASAPGRGARRKR